MTTAQLDLLQTVLTWVLQESILVFCVFVLGFAYGARVGYHDAIKRMHELNVPDEDQPKWSPRARDIANQMLDEESYRR